MSAWNYEFMIDDEGRGWCHDFCPADEGDHWNGELPEERH